MTLTRDLDKRRSCAAGRFFPSDPGALRDAVAACLDRGVIGRRPPGSAARAIVSPHAGFGYSGWLAGAAWRATARDKRAYAVILSPSHAHAFDGIAMPSQQAYLMPGHRVRIDAEARLALSDEGLARVEDAAHDREHGIETQLPFLHRLHPAARVLPLVIGRAGIAEIARVVDYLAAFRDTPPLFVVSSDLSHFLPRPEAEARDRDTARRIETGALAELTTERACGARGLAGFLASEYGAALRPSRLAMANSAAVTEAADRTVGYGAWAFFGAGEVMLAPRHRAALLKVARDALRIRLRKGKMPGLREETFAMPLRGHAASFVTLTVDGALRGCMGSLAPHKALVRDVAENAVRAGFGDARFAPLDEATLDRVRIGISVLSTPRALTAENEAEARARIVPGQDGLILRDGAATGTLLPQVWDRIGAPGAFLRALKQKAGLAPDHWSAGTRLERFEVERFSES